MSWIDQVIEILEFVERSTDSEDARDYNMEAIKLTQRIDIPALKCRCLQIDPIIGSDGHS